MKRHKTTNIPKTYTRTEISAIRNDVAKATARPPGGNLDDEVYHKYLKGLQGRFRTLEGEPLFETDATGLWEAYLKSFRTKAERQHHNCNECRRFIERYGGLVSIDVLTWKTVPVFWNIDQSTDPRLVRAVTALYNKVLAARIVRPFYSNARLLGSPVTGQWRHLGVYNSRPKDGTNLESPEQKAARQVEEFGMLRRAVIRYPYNVLNTAVQLLESDAAYRGQQVVESVKWFRNIQASWDNVANADDPDLILWVSVVNAPAGWAHIGNSVAATLIDDLFEGTPPSEALQKFNLKMDPLQYRRPTAAPKEGAIDAAEALVDKLGVRKSFARRTAKLTEALPFAYWIPTKASPQGTGMFDSVRAKPEPDSVDLGPMTWRKFREKVLRDGLPGRATRLQFYSGATAKFPFATLTTAMDAEAPPILQWDGVVGERNPVSWYYYHGGSYVKDYGLPTSEWVDVLAVTHNPCHWYLATYTKSQSALLFLNGARDQGDPPLCLFPETLKSELNGVRSVVERYSNIHKLDRCGEQEAAGIGIQESAKSIRIILRALVNGIWQQATIDRWD